MSTTELQQRAATAQPVVLDPADLAALGDRLPGPEPALCAPPADAGRATPLHVCEPVLDGNEARYLAECIERNWISSSGPFVRRFESAFADAVGASTGVATSSGTTALHLAIAALGIGPGDEVIVPSFTMIATANAVAYTGATPVFADSEDAHWNLSPAAFEAAITPRTRAVIVVHAYGHPAEMDPILAIARVRNIAVVEDAAEAHGAIYRGRPVGSIGDIAAFSFYGNKIVSTGEGGMLTTNDAALGAVARRLRDHAFSSERHFWHEYRGFSYRMTNLQAAVGVAQTERLDSFVARKRAHRAAYDDALRHIASLRLPTEETDVRSVFWMYLILVSRDAGITRDGLRATLATRGIETRTAFVPLHLQPIYRAAWRDAAFPVAEDVGRRGLYLPSGVGLAPSDIAFVAREVERACTGVSAPLVLFVSGKHPIREIGGFGHSVYVRAHARAASMAGYEPHVFCLGAVDAIEREPFGIVHQRASTIEPRQRSIGSLGPALADAMVDFARSLPVDRPLLIHGFGVWTYAGVLARRGLSGRRVGLVASSYTTHLDESRGMLAGARPRDGARRYLSLAAQYLWSAARIDRVERRAFRDADIVAVNYDAVRRAIVRRHGGAPNVRLVRYSSDDAFVHPVESLHAPHNAPPRVVSVSGHFARKGVDVLLQAYALLRDRGVAFAADVVGGGSLLDVHRELVARLGLAERVTIHGIVPDVGPYLDGADVYVLPSRSEQSGALSLIEALEHGLPAVASACDGIPEDLSGSEAGVLVPPGDARALADALARLLADPSERSRRSRAARALFLERFSPAAFAADIGRIYEDALALR